MQTRIEQLTAQVSRLADEVAGERQARRISLLIAAVSAVVIVSLVMFGLWFLWDSANDEKADRAQARVTSCEQQNEQQERSILANEVQVREVFKSLTENDTLTRTEQEQLDRLFENHDRVIRDSFPMRDCGPDGIDAYFDDDPATDPYVG